MTIGARMLKTGIAVAFALWLGALIGLHSPLLAAIAAIFTIQPSIYRSWKQVLEQIQSNLLGAAVAIGAVWLVGASPIAVGITCVCVILLCLRIGREETIGLTLVTVVVVMEAGGAQGWLSAADRLGAIMTGIVSAFAVNVAIAPPRYTKRFLHQMKETQIFLSRLLRTAVGNEWNKKLYRTEREQLQTRIQGLEQFHKLFAEERVWRRDARSSRARLLVVYRSMLESLRQGSALLAAIEDHYFSVQAAEAWNRLIDRQIESLCSYHEQLLWKWAGHIKPGAAAHAPPPEASALLTGMIAGQSQADDPTARARLLVIAAAVFSYENQLRRLDKLINLYWSRQKKMDQRG